MSKLLTFLSNLKGATAIEYALIASFIALAILGVLIIFGNDLNSLYDLLPDLLG